MEAFFDLYKSASVSSYNMASSIGVLESVTGSCESLLEALLENPKIKKDSWLFSRIETELKHTKRSRKIAKYFFEHRTEKEISWEEAMEACQEPVTVA